MKTDQEIIERIRGILGRDWLRAEREALAAVLPYRSAQRYLTDPTLEASWTALPRDPEAVLRRMRVAMPFAWDTANGRRPIGASRNLDHMSAWLWLLGLEAAADQVQRDPHHGKGRLRAICEKFSWDWKEWDDGVWFNTHTKTEGPPPTEVEPLRPGTGR